MKLFSSAAAFRTGSAGCRLRWLLILTTSLIYHGRVLGDEVELCGFPEMREHSLWLTKATVRTLRKGAPPVPVRGAGSCG